MEGIVLTRPRKLDWYTGNTRPATILLGFSASATAVGEGRVSLLSLWCSKADDAIEKLLLPLSLLCAVITDINVVCEFTSPLLVYLYFAITRGPRMPFTSGILSRLCWLHGTRTTVLIVIVEMYAR